MYVCRAAVSFSTRPEIIRQRRVKIRTCYHTARVQARHTLLGGWSDRDQARPRLIPFSKDNFSTRCNLFNQVSKLMLSVLYFYGYCCHAKTPLLNLIVAQRHWTVKTRG